MTLEIGQLKVEVKFEDEKHININPAKHLTLSKFNWNQSLRYFEYKMVPVKT